MPRPREAVPEITLTSLRQFCDFYELLDGRAMTMDQLHDDYAKRQTERGETPTFKSVQSLRNSFRKLNRMGKRPHFLKKGQAYTLAAAAKDFYAAAQPLVAYDESARGLVRSRRTTLVIAVSKSIFEYILPPVVDWFHRNHRDQVNVRYEMIVPKDTTQRLLDGQIDLALGWTGSDIDPTGLAREVLGSRYQFPIVLVAPTGQGLRLKKAVALSDLGRATVLHSDHPSMVDYVRAVRHQRHEVTLVEAQSMKMILEHVRCGSVCGLVPDLPWVLQPNLSRSEMTRHRFCDGDDLAIRLVIDAPPEGKASAAVSDHARKFLDCYRRELESLPGRKQWDAFYRPCPEPPNLLTGRTDWWVYTVGRHRGGPVWHQGNAHLQPVDSTTRPTRNTATGCTVELNGDIDVRKTDDLPLLSGIIQGHVSDTNHAGSSLELRGVMHPHPKKSGRAVPWSALFGDPISISTNRNACVLVGGRRSWDENGRVEFATMILSSEKLTESALRQVGDHMLVTCLQNAHRVDS